MAKVRKSDLAHLNALEETMRHACIEAYKGKLRMESLQEQARKRDQRMGLDHEYHGRDLLAAIEQAHALLSWALRG